MGEQSARWFRAGVPIPDWTFGSGWEIYPMLPRRTSVVRPTFSGIFVVMASIAVCSDTSVPPVAKKIPKEIIVHGDKRVDDYFWLREKTNSEVIAYLEQENAYGDAVT